ncbi:MAG: hypothetical protein WAT74_06730, partial [Flavobacteriales bacterium]
SVAIVRLFHSANEFAAYAAADPVVNVYADAGVAHYVGLMEDCNLPNNPAGNIWIPIFPASPALEPRIQGNGGTHGYTAVLANDGELYITTMGLPLPVELLSFSARRNSVAEVRLDWVTATEMNNAGFELWRLIEGEDAFTQVAWLDGHGTTQQLTSYEHADGNPTDRVSYYRLKQVDITGHSTWSDVVAVEGARVAVRVIAYPNPARDHMRLSGLPEDAEAIMMHDAAGRLVKQWPATSLLDGLGALERGVYSIAVQRTSGAPTTLRIVLE